VRSEQQRQMTAGGTPGPAATAPPIPHNAPPAARPFQQSQTASVEAPINPGQHASPVVPKPLDERLAAEPHAGGTAVPADGSPVAASGSALPPLIENNSHRASPRNTAE
jgi:hypothetical protein